MNNKKNEINKALQQLIGLHLSRTTRVGMTECLKFGFLNTIEHHGIETQIGEFGLHLQCPWRFTKGDKIIVGDNDIFEQPDENAEYDENFNWDIQGSNLRDVKLATLLIDKHTVKAINSDNLGGFELLFDQDMKLTVFPTLSSVSEYSEYWRLLNNKDKNKNHFVVGTFGIEN